MKKEELRGKVGDTVVYKTKTGKTYMGQLKELGDGTLSLQTEDGLATIQYGVINVEEVKG